MAGAFSTGDTRSYVSVLVIDETNFENWVRNLDYDPVTQTGYVPGGKISPTLEPGTYFLIIDNRENKSDRSVRVDFGLE